MSVVSYFRWIQASTQEIPSDMTVPRQFIPWTLGSGLDVRLGDRADIILPVYEPSSWICREQSWSEGVGNIR